MAGRGKYRGKRKTGGRRRRYARRKGGYPRMGRQMVHRFTRTDVIDTAIPIPAGFPGSGFGFNFTLNQLPNASEFTQLFDQYCIKAIKVSLVPKQGIAVQQGLVTAGALQAVMPKVWSVIDYDDSSAPAALTDLLQYQNTKCTRANQWHTRYFKPAVADEIYNTGITTAYGMKRNTWIDCNNSTVEHYGLRIYVEPSTGNTPRYDLDMIIKFYMEFKNVR